MTYTLENASLHFNLNPDLARWNLISRAGPLADRQVPAVLNAQTGFFYYRGRAYRNALDSWPHLEVAEETVSTSPHGPLRQLDLSVQPEAGGLHFQLTFAIPEAHPFLLIRLAVENRGSEAISVDRLELLSAGFIYRQRSGLHGSLQFVPEPRSSGSTRQRSGLHPLNLAFFSNGWQSWSHTRVYGETDRYQSTRLGPFNRTVLINAGTPKPRRVGLFASDMFGVLGDRGNRVALLAGFLSQREHFGSLEAYLGLSRALRLWANGDGVRLAPGERMQTDWACLTFLHLDSADPLGPYLEAVSREHGLIWNGEGGPAFAPNRKVPVGWCSWYHFFQEVSAQDIRQNLAAAGELAPGLPLDLIQIDDGFEAQVGDWFSLSPKFSEGLSSSPGMGGLAAEIRRAGFTPGLWLAPFILHPRARLIDEHPEWVLRGAWNRPVNAGFIWDTFTTALDLTHPGALDYASEVVRTAAHDWGYPYLKLDFLYAGALPGRHRDPTRTRAQVLRKALVALREAAGEEVALLGCGCPLGSAVGLVEAMRISADVDPKWAPVVKGIRAFFKNEPDLPAARNAIHNSLTRAFTHNRWWINDPDCLLLRPDIELTLAEVQALASVIALTGGSLLLSDHLPDLPPERLRIARALLPLIGRRPHVLDWFDSPTPSRLQIDLSGPCGAWHLLGVFNWEDRARDVSLDLGDFYLKPSGEYFAREFWRGQSSLIDGQKLTLRQVPAHGAALLALRAYRPYLPQYLGSDLHVSQGLEVTAWEPAPQALDFELARPGAADGAVVLGLPWTPGQVVVNDRPVDPQPLGEGQFRLPLAFHKNASIHLQAKG